MKTSCLFCMLQAIYISRVVEGGQAHRDKKLQVGDKILSVSLLLSAIVMLRSP